MKKQKYNYKNLSFLLLGISSTCSILAFVGMGRVISLYTIFLVISFYILITDKKRNVSLLNYKSSKYYCIWTFISLLSALFGMLFFMDKKDWLIASASYIPKLLLYFVLLYLLLRSVNGIMYSKSLLTGLIYGVGINAVWATMDAVIYYLSGYSITNEIFRNYIIATGTRYDMLSLIIGGVIRSGGFNGDPANIGMFAPVLASYGLYSKKYWLYLLAVLSVFASVSIVALASILILSVIYMFSSTKAMGIGIVCIIILIITISSVSLQSDGISSQMISAVAERLEEKTESDTQDKDNVRVMYWVKFLPAVANTPTALIIGTGYGTASYAYINGGFVNRSEPYDPEQTYCSTYFDVGLWGFLSFLLLHLYLLRNAYRKRQDETFLMLFAGMEGIMISCMGYHDTIYSVSMLFVIAGIVKTSNNLSLKYLR